MKQVFTSTSDFNSAMDHFSVCEKGEKRGANALQN